MKPAAFAYVAAESADEAVAALAEHGDAAKVLAGGQSLVPLMNMRLARPAAIVDINRCADLGWVRPADAGGVMVGATVRQRALERDPLLTAGFPLLGEVARQIGHVQIRNRGTVVGSMAHADPAAELPAAALLLDAELVARSARGHRAIAARYFFVSYLTTDLAPDELVVEVRLPALPPGAGWGVSEVARRHGDFALAGALALLAAGPDGTIHEARLALFGVGSTPVRLSGVERALVGARPDERVLVEAARSVRAEIEPEGDIHASGPYRAALAVVVAERALRQAAERMTTGGPVASAPGGRP